MRSEQDEHRKSRSRSSTASLKIVVVGDTGVGKTSLIQQFVMRRFNPEYKATIGSDFTQKMVTLDSTDGTPGEMVWLHIWDTAGQERFRSISSTYYRGCDCAIVVFDVCREDTFERVGYWIDDAATNADVGAKDELPVIVVANKIDVLASERAVQSKRALEVCKAHRATYAEASAKHGDNVDAVFRMAARMALNRQAPAPEELPSFVGSLRTSSNGAATRSDPCPC